LDSPRGGGGPTQGTPPPKGGHPPFRAHQAGACLRTQGCLRICWTLGRAAGSGCSISVMSCCAGSEIRKRGPPECLVPAGTGAPMVRRRDGGSIHRRIAVDTITFTIITIDDIASITILLLHSIMSL
jgi:hypothetical protein